MIYEMKCQECGKTWEKKSPQNRCISCCGNDVESKPLDEPNPSMDSHPEAETK
jgi:hypothetical protein